MADLHVERRRPRAVPRPHAILPFDVWWAIGEAMAAALILAALRLTGAL